MATIFSHGKESHEYMFKGIKDVVFDTDSYSYLQFAKMFSGREYSKCNGHWKCVNEILVHIILY